MRPSNAGTGTPFYSIKLLACVFTPLPHLERQGIIEEQFNCTTTRDTAMRYSLVGLNGLAFEYFRESSCALLS